MLSKAKIAVSISHLQVSKKKKRVWLRFNSLD
jgi:hypothetical protein